jgi:hypothetical protein
MNAGRMNTKAIHGMPAKGIHRTLPLAAQGSDGWIRLNLNHGVIKIRG